jgi:hypothetical protein
VVSLGYDADGTRIRRKLSGQTRDRGQGQAQGAAPELDAGVGTAAGYTVDMAMADWLAEGMPGRTAKTVEVYRDALGSETCLDGAGCGLMCRRAGMMMAGCALSVGVISDGRLVAAADWDGPVFARVLGRTDTEQPVHGFGSGGQRRPELAPVYHLGRSRA